MTIASLILSGIANLSFDAAQIRRVQLVGDRLSQRCDTGAQETDADVCDAINAADSVWQGYVARLSGECEYAGRCDRAVDRILSRHYLA